MKASSTLNHDVDTRETARLISSEKVVGTAVYNGQDEHLGSVHSIMLDKVSGQVAYAVMSFGGFLGIGESYHPLPWRVLTYDVNRGGYVVDIDRHKLEGAPTFSATAAPDWKDRAYGSKIDEYYGLPPYSY